MNTKNYYPQFPEIPYKRTSVEMALVVLFANSLLSKYDKEVIRTAYCIFRNESFNGKAGVNFNFIGCQADVAKWEGLDLTNIIGTCVKVDSGGDTRRFLCFNDNGYETCFDFVCYKVKQRGMFVGAPGINTPDDLALSYLTKWVGLPAKKAATKIAEIGNFKSLYASSLKAIK